MCIQKVVHIERGLREYLKLQRTGVSPKWNVLTLGGLGAVSYTLLLHYSLVVGLLQWLR